MCRTAMAPVWSCACHGVRSPSSSKPSPTAAMLARPRPRPPPSASKSSESRPTKLALRCILAGGLLNDSSPGSVAIEGSGKIRRRRSRQPGHSSTLLPSCSSSAAWEDAHDYGTDSEDEAVFWTSHEPLRMYYDRVIDSARNSMQRYV